MTEFRVSFSNKPIITPFERPPYKVGPTDMSALNDLFYAREVYGDVVRRGEETLTFEDPELRQLIAESVALEEINALDALRQAYATVAVDELVAAYEAAAALSAELPDIGEAYYINNKEYSQFDQLAEEAVALAPSAREQILETIEARKAEWAKQESRKLEKIDDMALGAAILQRSFVQGELAVAAARMMHAYEAWPVPRFRQLSQIALADVVSTPVLETGEEIDEELETMTVEDQIVEMLTLYVNEQIDINELVLFFEDDEEFDSDPARRRQQIISLFRGETGDKITQLMYRNNLFVIHGWKLSYDKNGSLVRERAMKTVSTDALLESTFDTQTFSYGETTTAFLWGVNIEEDMQDELDKRDALVDMREEPVQEVQAVKEEDTSWEDGVKEQIGIAIMRLEEMNLLTSEDAGVNRHQITARTGAKRVMGTATNIDRLIAGKLISRTAKENRHYEFAPTELVLMMMYNTSRDFFRETSRKKQAIDMIDSILARYFERKRQREAIDKN